MANGTAISQRTKISLNQFIWSQVKLIPKDNKFFYVSPADRFAIFTWYETGNMRGSSGVNDITLSNPFRFSNDEKKLRGEVITAGSFLELIIEGLLYVTGGVYDPGKAITRKQLNSIISDKVEKRTDWLKLQGVIKPETKNLAKEFFTFRNKVTHSYTFKDLIYRGEPISKDNWDSISEKIIRDYNRLELNLLNDYYHKQAPVIAHVFTAIRQAQTATGQISVAALWGKTLRIEDVDIRDIENWEDVIDMTLASF